MKDYQLIVFDWDGTLMDSTHHIVSCMRRAIAVLNLPVLPDQQIRQIIGLGLPEAVRTLYPEADQQYITSLAQAYRDIWHQEPSDSLLFEHARPLLKKLDDRGILLAVATGKGRRGLNKVLAETQLAKTFVTTRCADESHSKPNPQMLHDIMDFCGLPPEKTLMIGDTEYDLKMAHNARVASVGISHGAHSVAQLENCQPLAVLSDLLALDDWLECTAPQF